MAPHHPTHLLSSARESLHSVVTNLELQLLFLKSESRSRGEGSGVGMAGDGINLGCRVGSIWCKFWGLLRPAS